MKPNPIFPFVAATITALLSGLASPARAHKHLDGGVESQTPGSKLLFLNLGNFTTNTGFLYRLTPTNHVALGPIYRSGTSSRNDPDLENNPVFTSLPVEPDNGGPHENAPLPGALIVLRVVNVDGPKGGSLSMWDSDGDFIAEEITFTVPVGTTNSAHQFFLSEGDGSPGSDPYGHIHGRRFSVDRPGLYTVSFQMVDLSTNGPGGGPLHAPSDLVPMYFQADTTLLPPVVGPEGAVLTFGTETLRTYVVESAPILGPSADWTAFGEPIPGNGRLHTTAPLPVSAEARFYRLRITQP
jgi:hypothetical protein